MHLGFERLNRDSLFGASLKMVWGEAWWPRGVSSTEPVWLQGRNTSRGSSGGAPVSHHKRDQIPAFQDIIQQLKKSVQLMWMNSYNLALKQKAKHADLGVLTAHFLQKVVKQSDSALPGWIFSHTLLNLRNVLLFYMLPGLLPWSSWYCPGEGKKITIQFFLRILFKVMPNRWRQQIRLILTEWNSFV